LLLSVVPAVLELDETVGLGLLFALRGPVPAPQEVVVVNISRDSAAGVGQTEEVDEWPRELHADLVDALARAGAAVVAFDIMFEEPRPGDLKLAASIARAGNVILVEEVETRALPGNEASRGTLDIRKPPVPELHSAALGAAPFILPEVPIRVSQFWTFGRTGGDVPSLPVAALQAFLLRYYDEFAALLIEVRPRLRDEITPSRSSVEASHDVATAMRAIRVEFQRDPRLPSDAREALTRRRSATAVHAEALALLIDLYSGPSSRYLNFYGPPRTVRTIPYDVASSSAESLGLQGKMVFVGFAEPRQPEQQDDFYSIFSERTGANLSGVEIGATAFANLLDSRSVEPLAMPSHLLLVIAWGALLAVLVIRASTHLAMSFAALAALLYLGTAYSLFAAYAIWVPVIVPLGQVLAAVVIAVFANYARLARQRERVQAALGYYVPRALVRRLAEESVGTSANHELLHGTCLFTDAEEYTTVSEGLRPEALAALMNEYYRVMFRVVERHGGLVSDTSGDSMVAIWTTATPDHLVRGRACRAALEIVAAIAEFNSGRGAQRLPTRVGLESGEMFLGNIGAEQRFEYRAIGDIVNTASRLQGLNRLLGTRVLLSDATLAGVDDLATRDLGAFLLRGKRVPVRVHEPLGMQPASLDDRLVVAPFAAALELVTAARWDEAERAFREILARVPGDGPSAFYAELCADYRRNPRPWHGAVSVQVK
jgi:adenylate cyclase